MCHGPGLFHVYFAGVGDTSLNYTQQSPLYLVTFTSRDEADRWWRATQLSSHNTSRIRRFSPQFIMAPLPNVRDGWECIIQALKDSFNPRKAIVASADSRVDHLNGGGFRIRSATEPYRYWSLRGKGGLRVLEPIQNWNWTIYESPTKFIIRRLNELPYDVGRKEEDVLIGEDDVEILVAPRWVGEIPTKLYMKPLADVATMAFNVVAAIPDEHASGEGGRQYIFKFSWFENGFYIQNSSQTLYELFVTPGEGDRWELVE